MPQCSSDARRELTFGPAVASAGGDVLDYPLPLDDRRWCQLTADGCAHSGSIFSASNKLNVNSTGRDSAPPPPEPPLVPPPPLVVLSPVPPV